MSFRTFALFSLVLLTACGNEAPKDAAKTPADAKADTKPGAMPKDRLPPNDPHASPSPTEDDSPPPLMASTPGTFDVTVKGTLAHYQRIPTGQNRAIADAKSGVSRVSVAATKGDDGWPHVRLTLDDFRPDQAQYPMTVSSSAKDGPKVSVRYQLSEPRIYQIDPDKDANITVTLESYEGATLKGSFEGTLAPTAAGLGDPVPIKANFSVKLGLRNVEPDAKASADAKADANAKGDAKAPADEKGDADAKGDAKAPPSH